jgi:hypothetical protein
MRKALNENPVVRAVVLGIMGLLVAFLLFTRVFNANTGSDAPNPPTGTISTEAAAAGAAPAPAGDAAAPAPAAEATPPPAEATAPPAAGSTPAPAVPSTPAAADPSAAFIPGPGLPEDVVVAYAQNKAVVLLIEKKKGLDDRAISQSVKSLGSRGDTEVFVVPVKQVSRYARITEGVSLDRTPAIVVLRPRKLTDNVPEATVSYGFRGPESVEQAVEDALFDGKNVTYDP